MKQSTRQKVSEQVASKVIRQFFYIKWELSDGLLQNIEIILIFKKVHTQKQYSNCPVQLLFTCWLCDSDILFETKEILNVRLMCTQEYIRSITNVQSYQGCQGNSISNPRMKNIPGPGPQVSSKKDSPGAPGRPSPGGPGGYKYVIFYNIQQVP